jgi:4-hydroxy-2-oxoheptanedioate aldolase
MQVNPLLAKFENRKKMIGAFFNSGTVVSAEILGGLGFDFIVIDTEHCQYDFGAVEAFIRASECRNLVPIVRIVDCSRNYILKMLDLGAMGLYLPFIKTADEVRKAVALAKYPPVGQRGLGHGHKVGYGIDPIVNTGNPKDYLEWANANTLIFPQCETVEAVENIDEILAVDGVAGIFIGPFDLSIAMGIPCQFDNPTFNGAVRRVKDACNKAGKMVFTMGMTPEDAKQKFDMGFDGVLATDTSFLLRAAKSYLAGIQALGYS